MAGGRTPEWRWVRLRRIEEVRAGLRDALSGLRRYGPASARKAGYAAAGEFLAKASGPVAERMLEHPALDYWLSLWRSHFAHEAPDEDWHLQFGLLGHFAASLALLTGKNLSCGAVLDPDGSFYLYDTPWALDFAEASRAPVTVKVAGGTLTLAGEGLEAVFSLDGAAPGGPARQLTEVVPGIVVDDRGWLQVHGVTMHGLATLSDTERASFAAPIRQALLDMRERDPKLHAELSDLLHVLVPLQNPNNYSSVSSSYAHLRGVIGLSPSPDVLLQAETLIHESSHLKLNQLLAADPILPPGQNGQVYYSPWRPDARRLRGLLIGAHAFLNVGRYLARSLQRETYPDTVRLEVMSNVAKRLFQVEAAMRAVTENGTFTPFGREFVFGVWREIGLLRHAVQWFPPALVAEQKAECDKHYAEYALAGTVLHKVPGQLIDAVPRARYAPAGAPLPAEEPK